MPYIYKNGRVYGSGGGSSSNEVMITATLTAGTTSVTFTNEAITSSAWIDYYTSQFGVNPTSISVSTGSATLTFPANQNDITVGLVIKEAVDNVNLIHT